MSVELLIVIAVCRPTTLLTTSPPSSPSSPASPSSSPFSFSSPPSSPSPSFSSPHSSHLASHPTSPVSQVAEVIADALTVELEPLLDTIVPDTLISEEALAVKASFMRPAFVPLDGKVSPHTTSISNYCIFSPFFLFFLVFPFPSFFCFLLQCSVDHLHLLHFFSNPSSSSSLVSPSPPYISLPSHPHPAAQAAAEGKNSMGVVQRKLNNGMRVNMVSIKDEPQRASVRLYVPGGRMLETKGTPGSVLVGSRTIQEGGAFLDVTR